MSRPPSIPERGPLNFSFHSLCELRGHEPGRQLRQQLAEHAVQEEAQPKVRPVSAQLLAQRYEMVVVHPDQIVILKVREQHCCEKLVDPSIAR